MRALRAACLEASRIEDFTRVKFVVETGTNRMYCRRRCYARVEGGQRAHQATPLHGGPNVTLVAALEAVSQDAAHWITEADAKNWFDYCGYYVH